jgi:hypothetical protein
MITLSRGAAAYTFANLTEHPYGYDESDVRRGRSARRWAITGIVSRGDAPVITGLYDAWQAARILEDDPARTGVVGATVSFTGEAPGYNWATAVPCWFTGAPQIAMAGAFCRVSLTLTDAAQALAVILRQGEEEAEQAAQLNLGTLTFGSATVNLTARPTAYADLPQLTLNPAGRHVITGPLQATEQRQVQGWVDATNLAALETWLTTTVATTPASGAWFPTSWSPPVARRRADGNTIGTYFDVSFTVARIR